ncbi:ATP-binding protein [Ensifer adhaerens]|nr:ATP-binding protein [Ensifer canadensis]
MMDDKTTSAPAGLAGYDYQVDVSIYLALDLMLVRKRLDAITLEPANHEDLAADLKDETQVSAATRIMVGGYPLIVQAKLRHGEPWSDTDLETLLTKGKKRKSPKILLTEDTTLRYLLVTSAATKGVARGLRMVSVGGTWPTKLPPDIGSRLLGLDGRVAVLDGLDEAKLDGQIRDLLQTTCKVPLTHIPNCIKELRTVALEHMRNGPSVWTKDALERTITAFGGYLTTAPEVGMFVKPTNWAELQKKLATQYGVIISGSSGTGKTTAAEVLLDELRSAEYGAFKVIRVTGGPEQVWKSKETGRVVFMIEDPWGKYRYHPEQGVWNRDLDRM